MAVPTFTMRQLLEAGVHFGHHTRRWNPRMGPYIFGIRNGIHIMDLQQTVPMLYRALEAVSGVVGEGGRVLFVGTKRQAQETVAEAARQCGQYFVNHRWLGGMLTNWKTISNSIDRLRNLEEQLAQENIGLTKKESLQLQRERDKLEQTLGGIKEMAGLPDILFVIDTNKEHIAVAEARKLNIPVVAVLDSNSDPEGVEFPVPGNDDAIRAISLYCELITGAVLDGIEREMVTSGQDIGVLETVPQEQVAAPADAPEEAPEALAGSKEAVEVAEAVVDAPGPEALAEPEEVAEVAEAVAHVPASEAPAADETAESGGAASDAETNDAKETN
ncbi:MAG: 30S ribosomal protein S2 [Alphaproteobacteria bacterium]|nr:30S ribosomal protein S2 [Alphaproteobacteria bacterium]